MGGINQLIFLPAQPVFKHALTIYKQPVNKTWGSNNLNSLQMQTLQSMRDKSGDFLLNLIGTYLFPTCPSRRNFPVRLSDRGRIPAREAQSCLIDIRNLPEKAESLKNAYVLCCTPSRGAHLLTYRLRAPVFATPYIQPLSDSLGTSFEISNEE